MVISQLRWLNYAHLLGYLYERGFPGLRLSVYICLRVFVLYSRTIIPWWTTFSQHLYTTDHFRSPRILQISRSHLITQWILNSNPLSSAACQVNYVVKFGHTLSRAQTQLSILRYHHIHGHTSNQFQTLECRCCEHANEYMLRSLAHPCILRIASASQMRTQCTTFYPKIATIQHQSWTWRSI